MLPTPAEALTRLRAELDGLARRARNGLKHFAGVHEPGDEPTPRDQVWSRGKTRLFRYRQSAAAPTREPLLLVMSLVTKPTVFDLLPGNSVVSRLLDAGHDVFLLDWGTPDAVESQNTLETYCDSYLPAAVEVALEHSGAERVTLFGYCLGGLICMLTAAGHQDLPVRGMVLLAVPVDLGACGPLATLIRNARFAVETMLDETGNVPASTMLDAFRLLEPTGDVTTYLSLWNSLSDSQRLAAHQALVGWSNDHIPFPGATFRQLAEQFVRDGELVHGQVRLGDRTVRTADITMPVLSVVGERDTLVPAAASSPIGSVLPSARLDHLTLPAGHAGLMVGRRAQREFIPTILTWLDNISKREKT